MRFSLGNPIGTPFDVCCSEFARRNSGKLQGFTIHTNCNSSQGKKKVMQSLFTVLHLIFLINVSKK